MTRIYEALIALGLGAAVYLYVVAFDDFSETELVRLSYLWIGALAFGLHGLLASELSALVAAGEAATTREAVGRLGEQPHRSWLSRLSIGALPTLMVLTNEPTRRKPFFAALLATVLVLAALAFFFEAIFPGL